MVLLQTKDSKFLAHVSLRGLQMLTWVDTKFLRCLFTDNVSYIILRPATCTKSQLNPGQKSDHHKNASSKCILWVFRRNVIEQDTSEPLPSTDKTQELYE